MPRISLRAAKLIVSAAIPFALAALPASASTAAARPVTPKVSVKVVPTTSSSSAILAATVEIGRAPAHERGRLDATLYGPVTSTSCQSVGTARFEKASKTRFTSTVRAGVDRATLTTRAPKVEGCYAWGVTVTYGAGVRTSAAPSRKTAVAVSGIAVPITTIAPPSSPVNELVAFAEGNATVSWSAPITDGGSPITGYTVTAINTTDPSAAAETCTTSDALSCTITGLTTGDSYTFIVIAGNAVGSSPATATPSTVVPRPLPTATAPTAPGSPTDVAASAGDDSASLTWDAPSSDGGSAITGYTATATDTTNSANGGETCTTSSGTNCTVTGLANGDSYTFTVVAANSIGSSEPSTSSVAVTPTSGLTVPGAASDVQASAEPGAASVEWTAPLSDGGSAITGYTVTATDTTNSANGGQTCSTSGALTCTVTGLTNGDSYTFTVVASNAQGHSPTSASSVSATPATNPNAPLDVVANPGDASTVVSWTAPANDGGSAITGYTVTAVDDTNAGNGGETCTNTTTICTISGLTNGDSYTFSVVAINAVGASAASAPSGVVVPATNPDAPSDVTATPGNGLATVYWTPPASDGGSGITGYLATATDTTNSANGGETCSSSGTTNCTVTGLTNGDAITFTVTASNDLGTSIASSPSDSVTPATVPDAPSDATASSSEINSAVVSWTAPASDGGSAITGYLVTATDTTNGGDGGQTCSTSGATTCTVTGLNGGDTYTFSVQATNGDGYSYDSAPSTGVPVMEENTVVHALSVASEPEYIVTNPAETYAYTYGGSDTIDVIDLATNVVTATIVVGSAGPGDGPSSLTFNAAGAYAYATSTGSNIVDVINLATNTVTDTIDVANGPNDVTILPGGNSAWVMGQGSDVVSILDLSTNAVTGTFDLPEGSSAPVFNAAGTYAYSANSNDASAYVINVATSAVTTLAVGTSPNTVAVNPADTLGYVANYGSGTVSVISMATNTVEATISVGTDPDSVTFNSAGTYAYVTNQSSNNVSVIDVATNTVTATVAVGAEPVGVSFNNAGTVGYVVNGSADTVSVLNVATNAVTATIAVGAEAAGVYMSGDGDWGYVVNLGSNTVTAINLATNATTTITVGTTPINAILNSGATFMYLENMGSANVVVIALG